MWLRLPFPIIGFIIRWKSSSKFGIEVENFNFFCSCFFKKTLNFSTFHSNISKSKQAIKDLIMADEEQIIYFFDMYPFDLWTSIEMVEKIEHLDDFFWSFFGLARKKLKMKNSSAISTWKCFFYIEVAA